MNDPKLSREARRVYVAVCRLTRGRTDVCIDEDLVGEELQREALLDLTEEEFERYLAKVRREIAAAGGEIQL